MKNVKRSESKYKHSGRKKLKRIIALGLSVLMVTSVMDVSGFTNVKAETLDAIASVTLPDGIPTDYTDFATALSVAQSNSGSTLTLLGDVDRGKQTITVASGKSLTMNTNGHTLFFYLGNDEKGITVETGATFTLIGNSSDSATIKGTPAIKSTKDTSSRNPWTYLIYTKGTCTIESAYIEGNDGAGRGVEKDGGILTVKNSTIYGGGFSINNKVGEVYINDKVTLEGQFTINSAATVNTGAFLTVNNGNISNYNIFCINGSLGGNFTWNKYIGSELYPNAKLITSDFTSEDIHITDGNNNPFPIIYTGNVIDTKVIPKTIVDSAGVSKDVIVDASIYTKTIEKQGTDSNWSEVNEVMDAGTYRVKYTSADKTVTKEFTVAKATPTITFRVYTREEAPFDYGNGIYFHAEVTGVNNEWPDGTVTFKDGENIYATKDFDKDFKHYYFTTDQLDAGNHSFTAVYNPSSTGTGKNYESVVSTTIEQAIAKVDQDALNIAEVTGKKYGDTSFTLDTTGGSGTGEVTYSVPENNGVLSISGNTATIIGAGTVTVTAVKASDVNYNSATTTYDISIAKADAPNITFPTASGITYGQNLSESQLNGGSTQYGTFAWDFSGEGGDSAPAVNGGMNYSNVIFTPSADTMKNYETITNTRQTLGYSVAQATPTISLDTLVYGNSGNRTANLIVTVNYVKNGHWPTGTLKFIDCTNGSDVDITGAAAVDMTGSQTEYVWKGLADKVYKVKVVYSGDDDYKSVTSEPFEVDTVKKDQSPLTIGDIGTKTYGDGAFVLTTTGGTGDGEVSFTSSDPTIVSFPDPVLNAQFDQEDENTSNNDGAVATIHKAGTVTITATKYGDNTYNNTSTSITITIGKKALLVKADDKQNIVAGSAMPQLTYHVTGLADGDTFTSPTIETAVSNTNSIGEHDITISGGTLTNAESYDVTYTNAKLTIAKASIEGAVVSGITDQNYTGNALEQPELSVQVNGKTLTRNVDYTVKYKNNIAIGTASVTISGAGIYSGSIPKNFRINVSNGATYTIRNIMYRVTNPNTNGNGSVTFVRSTKSKSKLKGTFSIDDTVVIGGRSYKITAIDAKALKGYKNLTKVTIGKNVTTIGKEAFYNCKMLKTIIINAKHLQPVGKNAIKNIYKSAVIKVPSSKVKAYKKLFQSKTGFTKDKKIKKK